MKFEKPKTLRLRGKAYREFREQVFARAKGHCENCGIYVPLRSPCEGYSIFECGHVAHIRSRGAGGGDELSNVRWLCFKCHTLEHNKGRETWKKKH